MSANPDGLRPDPHPRPAEPSAAKLDGRFGGPTPHAHSPAGWYRTMDRGFAVEHFRFPAHPRRGERHTASDASVWVYSLTGTEWWELAEYAPQPDPAVRIAELEAALAAKRTQHAETLGFLERAYDVIEKDGAAYRRTIARLWRSRRRWQQLARPVSYFVSNVDRAEGDHDNLPDALAELASLRADLPGEDWRVYAVTEITERSSE